VRIKAAQKAFMELTPDVYLDHWKWHRLGLASLHTSVSQPVGPGALLVGRKAFHILFK
jgi:hypothetical protein